MPNDVEKQSRILMEQCKDQHGKFTSRSQAQLSFYKKMYTYFKSKAISMFKEDEETLQAQNRDLKLKNKDLEQQVISLYHSKKQLQEHCILLQYELSEAKRKLQLSQKSIIKKTKSQKEHGIIFTAGTSGPESKRTIQKRLQKEKSTL